MERRADGEGGLPVVETSSEGLVIARARGEECAEPGLENRLPAGEEGTRRDGGRHSILEVAVLILPGSRASSLKLEPETNETRPIVYEGQREWFEYSSEAQRLS